MKEITAKSGLVGFFDIMGYQSFLDNNDAEIATSEVLETISGINSRVSKHLSEFLQTRASSEAEKAITEQVKQIVDKIQWLVFSDTILMTIECESSDVLEGPVFVFAAGVLCRQLFDFGLPLRGAIKRGKYLINESCFAGRTIVEAYRMETSLELAACVIEEEEYQRFRGLITQPQNYANLDKIIVQYLTPLKDGQYKKLRLINFLHFSISHVVKMNADIRQMVLNSFWSHSKDISASAHIKARHTEDFFRFLKHKLPNSFQDTA